MWHVILTSCFPNCWKVVSAQYRDDNSTVNYFATKDQALAEAARRNKS